MPTAGVNIALATGTAVMARTNNSRANAWSALLMNIGIVGLVAAISAAGMMGLVDHLRPRVGDIIAFERVVAAADDIDPRITVAAADASPPASCVLDVRVMRVSGGSFVIEAVRFVPAVLYRAHWAGGPTGDGADDCGVTAELTLGERDVGVLKMAAERWAGRSLPGTPPARAVAPR